ncbi:MAG: PQQ-dependent sugar dehydrogenase [Rhodospirillales bacterium]|nr:PQQ-dependent sugar dehydrogenase [Acetobacter sp.]
MIRRLVWSAPLLLAYCATVLAQGNPPSRGREVKGLYNEQCAECHGPDMGGGSAPALNNHLFHSVGDDTAIANAIAHGHTKAGIPNMGDLVNSAEVRALVVYIHERSAAAAKTAHPPKSVALNTAIESEAQSFKLEPVIEGGLVEPWSLAFLPDGHMLVTERPGRLRLVEKGEVVAQPITGTPKVFGGEGGLLDVAIGPNYKKAGQDWVYLSYGDKNTQGLGMTAVLRAHLLNGALTDVQQIFKAADSAYRPGGQRFGSRLLFDGKGHLFFSVGDRAHPGDEQDLAHPNGKIHRVMEDGSIPKDNPFVHTPGALGSIWSYGHRNAQGLVFDPEGKVLWESEHGPRGGDELNIIRRGANYGWCLITFGINYDGTPITDHVSQSGMDDPIKTWVPSIATGPLAFYTGNHFPHWKNNLFVGSLATQSLRRLELTNGKVTHEEILFEQAGRVRDIINGPDGFLYVVLNAPDRIVRLVPAS